MSRFLSKKTEPKPVGLNRFWFDYFFNKNQTEQKIITPILTVGSIAG
jgi:hypothetical protein